MRDPSFTKNKSNGINTSLFFVVLLTGILSIVSLKIMDAHQVIVTIIPVTVMLLYAGFIYYVRKLRLRLDQAGDNLYYLGFLFTLTSLAYSLFEFGTNDSVASSIITNFGIAIWTTITGLALRVLFSQMRTDPIETEQLARVELANASRHLRNELDESAREFMVFRQSLQQMTSEAFADLKASLDNSLRDGLNKFEANVDLFSNAVIEANSGFVERSSDLKQCTDKLVGNISMLSNRIDSIEIESDIFVQKLEPVISTFDEKFMELSLSVEEFSRKINEIKISDNYFIDQLKPAIDKISEAADIAKNNASLDGVRASSWSDLAGRVEPVIQSIDISLRGIEHSSALFSDGERSINSAAASMNDLAISMNDTGSKLQSVISSTDQEFSRMIESIVAGLDRLSTKLDSQALIVNQSIIKINENMLQIKSVKNKSPESPEESIVEKKDVGRKRNWFGISSSQDN